MWLYRSNEAFSKKFIEQKLFRKSRAITQDHFSSVFQFKK